MMGFKVYKCQYCGRILGVVTDDVVEIKHKGRRVRVVPEGKCTVFITCDNEACKKTGMILFEGLDAPPIDGNI